MDIVIVGGGYAGVSCALRLAHRARRQGTPATVRLVHPTPVLVERIRLHQAAAGQQLRERRIDPLLRRAGVERVPGWVEAIDPDRRTLRVGDRQLRWDRLVLALGSRPASHEAGSIAAHAATLDAGEVGALRDRLAALPQRARVLVVGGGLTALEGASEIAAAHPQLSVTLASAGRVAEGFSEAARTHALEVLRGMGVDVREGLRIEAHGPVAADAAGPADAAPAHAVPAARPEDNPPPFDLVLWTAGFDLPPLPRDAGLRVNDRGQVLVDPQLRSVSHPWIYAAGDIAAPVLAPGQELPMGCKSAMPLGVHVADNLARELAGRALRAFDYALLFYCVSLGRRDGVIQWADDAGRPTGRVLTGRRAAGFKEMICLSTWWALVAESHGLAAVAWKRTGRAPQALPRSRPARA